MTPNLICKCGKAFYKPPCRIKTGRGKYCSQECKYKYRTRPRGLIYVLKKENPTTFKKGHIPWHIGKKGLIEAWNKGIKGTHFSPSTEFKKKHKPWNKDKEFLQIRAENHFKWKGDDVGYCALHRWMHKRLTKPTRCTFCKEEKSLDLANRSHQYKRDINDWIWLCRKCHKRMDLDWRKSKEIININNYGNLCD